MFIDELQVHIKAGNGGDGIVSWIHEKAKEFGGPGGGNGGNGGDVYIKGVRDTNLLASYRHIKNFEAENGQNGRRNVMHGKAGEDLIVDIPIGSIVKNLNTGEAFELLEEGKQLLILDGGRGGLGNAHFKGSKNVSPEQSTLGTKTEDVEFYIELDLIADAGIIGLPNAGKSTFLNFFTSANVKTADYMFTTLDPNLGNFYGYILADIPGLIEGASAGKGLGHKFLRHIKRTGMLIHLVSAENEDVVDAYETIVDELSMYDKTLLEKKEIVILSKTDLVSSEEVEEKKNKLQKKLGKEVITITLLDDKNIKDMSDKLAQALGDNPLKK